jgi:membrane protease YdiL (CAAX protease family)
MEKRKKKYQQLVSELSDKELLLNLFLTNVLVIIIAVILGFFFFDSFAEFWKIFNWIDKRIITIGVSAGAAVVLLDLILMKVVPSSWFDDGGINKKIFQNRTVGQIAVIALSVAVSEEILFRGVIQTQFGLLIASLIFALVHYRYLFNWFLFVNVVVLSFLIGYIYFLTENLLVTIVMHFVIDFFLGVIYRLKFGGCKETRTEEEGSNENE